MSPPIGGAGEDETRLARALLGQAGLSWQWTTGSSMTTDSSIPQLCWVKGRPSGPDAGLIAWQAD